MRSSPAALARIFLQHHGRGKGKKASTPRIDTRTTTLVLDEGAVEAEVLPKGKPVTLMQFIFLGGGEVRFTGGDHAPVTDFIGALEQAISDVVFLVQKCTESNRNTYLIETLTWEQDRYKVTARDVAAKPPKICVWRESSETALKGGQNSRPPSLYQRTAGQIVLRLRADEDAASLLAQARRAAKEAPLQDLPSYTSVVNPVVHISMSMQLSDYERVFAKIGLNLVAHLFGESYVRHHAFNRTKRAILTGKSRIWLATNKAGEAFNGVPHDRHAMTLIYQKSRAGRFHLALLIRLYGTTTVVHLSNNAVKPPIEYPVFFVVDYNAHKIEQLMLHEFVALYPPAIPEDFRDTAKGEWIRRTWSNSNLA